MWDVVAKFYKHIHTGAFYLGLSFLSYSITSAILYGNSHFYTLFALGTFFVMDFVDYKLNNTSILTFFLNKRHLDALLLFIVIATIGCFVVDFVLGVNITQMWRWRDYKPIHFLVMFFFMNAAYILGMYELYRVIRTVLQNKLPDTHLIRIYFDHRVLKLLARISIGIGILGFFVPLLPILTGKNYYVEYLMLFPFLALILISDSVNYLLNGRPVIANVIRLNPVVLVPILLTSLLASILTEMLNVYGKEWEYMKMPFSYLHIQGVPLAVFIGWIPLVFSTVCMVNLAKHYSYSRHR